MANLIDTSRLTEATKLGEGGFGKVYRYSEDTAVKVINIIFDKTKQGILDPSRATKEKIIEYVNETRQIAQKEISYLLDLNSCKNIVDIKGHFVEEVEKNGQLIGCNIYILMELLIPLSEYLENIGFKYDYPDENEVIKIGMDILNALEECSFKKIIHRDIKPSNILVDKAGNYKLSDFGISTILESTNNIASKWSEPYAPPEVKQFKKYDCTIDFYSLALVLYRLLNDDYFPSEPADLNNVSNSYTPPCHASKNMSTFLYKALQYDPQNRFRSASEMKQALSLVGSEITLTFDSEECGKEPETEKFFPLPQAIERDEAADTTEPIDPEEKFAPENTHPYPPQPSINKNRNYRIRYDRIVLAILILLLIGALIMAYLCAKGVIAIPFIPSKNESKVKETEISAIYSTPEESATKPNNESLHPDNPPDRTLMELIDAAKKLAEKGEYKEALRKITIALEISPDSEDLLKLKEQYTNGLFEQTKKNILKKTDEFTNQGYLDKAITELRNNLKDYQNDSEYMQLFTEYCNEYRAEIISKADEYAKNENYQAAIELTNEALEVLPNDKKIEEVKQEYENKHNVIFMDMIEDYIAKSDYDSAIDELKKACKDYPSNTDFSEKLKELEKEKEEFEYKAKKAELLSNAENAFINEGYEQAIKILQSDTELSKDSEVQEKISEYKTYKPTNLFEMEYWDSSSNVKLRGPLQAKDNMGETHQLCYKLEDPSNDNRYVAYKINGKYNHLRGKFFLSYDNRSAEKVFTFNVYDDYSLLLYTATVEKGVEPISFDVDISGVDNLIIEVVSTNHTWAGDDWGCTFESVTVSK